MTRGDRVAKAIGGVGTAALVAHVLLGAAVVPPMGVLAGALVVLVGLGLHVLLARRARRLARTTPGKG